MADFQALVAFDRDQTGSNIKYLIGVDEAGRGALAGSMFAAAVVLRSPSGLENVDDSKRLGAGARERLAQDVQSGSLAWGIAQVTAREIDARGLDWTNRIVFTRAVQCARQRIHDCTKDNTLVLVDGIRPPLRCPFPHRTVKSGDRLSLTIAAASIIAKTARDRYCVEVMDALHPEYGFAGHKGYATAAHYAALEKHGPSPLHRQSYNLRLASTK